MRLIAILMLVLLAGAVDAIPETIQLCDYDVSFDLGSITYTVAFDGHYTANFCDRSLNINIVDDNIINVTNFDGGDQIIPEMKDASIVIELGPRMGVPTGNSSDIQKWVKDTKFPHTVLDNLTRWNLRDTYSWEHPHPKSEYKTIQIDRSEGRLLTDDPKSCIVATYIVDTKEFVRISALFGGLGLHESSLDSASSEEIDFKLSYLENFLKTLHIEKRE